ncbi:transaldolase [Thermoplasmatales archaeon ex4484_30]|nr:MAG: transaldolase [Thermoplasmata archaeon]OYT59581.1 MAG: transaldolase [Thermoplasmatales archaeon ex4484_30]
MKIFIDTADIEEIKEAKKWGILDGVTTNPSLIKKAVEKFEERGISMEEYIKEICRIVDGPVSLEVKALDADEMIKEAEILYDKFNDVNNNVVIKIPINTAMSKEDKIFEGIEAIKELNNRDIPTNATLVMTPTQALLAAKAGATYVSPFLGRIDDYIRSKLGIKFGKWDLFRGKIVKKIEEKKQEEKKGEMPLLYSEMASVEYGDNGIYDGIEMVESIVKIYRAYGFKTKIIAASVRNVYQVRKVAEMGVDIATIPFNVIKEMICHYKTMEGMKKFTEDVVEEYKRIFE